MGRLAEMEGNLKSRNVTVNIDDQDSSSYPYTIMDLEIDRGCQTTGCNSTFVLNATKDIKLYAYNEVPDWLKGNPYVRNGYRAFLPSSLCFRSLFMWSNETVNIWSHLLGFVFFGVISLYDNFILIPLHHGTLADHIVVTLALICYQFCMICSAGYHMFSCHSEKASKRWLAADLAGVSVGLIGCYLPAVHYAFYCLSIWRDLYLIIISILSAVVLFFQFHPRYLSPAWHRHRMFLYCALAAYGVIPTMHWVYLNGGWGQDVVLMFFPKVTVMYLLGCMAFIFYLTKFPERCFPGRVDFIGSSHQWWHVIIVFAFYYWHNTGQEFLVYRHNEKCF